MKVYTYCFVFHDHFIQDRKKGQKTIQVDKFTNINIVIVDNNNYIYISIYLRFDRKMKSYIIVFFNTLLCIFMIIVCSHGKLINKHQKTKYLRYDNNNNYDNKEIERRRKLSLMEGITIAHLKIVLCLAQIMKVNGLAH